MEIDIPSTMDGQRIMDLVFVNRLFPRCCILSEPLKSMQLLSSIENKHVTIKIDPSSKMIFFCFIFGIVITLKCIHIGYKDALELEIPFTEELGKILSMDGIHKDSIIIVREDEMRFLRITTLDRLRANGHGSPYIPIIEAVERNVIKDTQNGTAAIISEETRLKIEKVSRNQVYMIVSNYKRESKIT
jgi:hypothetical protein